MAKNKIDSIDQIKREVQARKFPKQERGKKTADSVLAGARAILEREGSKGLSARKLAKECGLSTGSIYDNFPGISAVLYALYEERVNKKNNLHRDFFELDSDELPMDELIGTFIREDASLEWGGALDLALRDAIQGDEKLRQLQDHNFMMQRESLVDALRIRNEQASDAQLKILAVYLQGLSQLSFQLRHVAKVEEGDLIRDITLMAAKRVATYVLQTV